MIVIKDQFAKKSIKKRNLENVFKGAGFTAKQF